LKHPKMLYPYALVATLVAVFFAVPGGTVAGPKPRTQPNIIFMFGDDLGFNELGYLGCSATSTPNIDKLANDGLILWHNYVAKICSPSRSAFMSGRYPSKLGLQNNVFNVEHNISLTRQVSILSEEFHAAGYSTHMIGKWHLGFQSWEYTPTYRGFDTFHGYLGGLTGYFNKSQCYGSGRNSAKKEFVVNCYYDLRVGEKPDWNGVNSGEYGTFLQRDQALELLADKKYAEDPFFLYLAWQSSHIPDEAPAEYTAMYYHDTHHIPSRHICQAQTTALDDSVGAVAQYLKENGLWEDTLLVFSSDNGGQFNRHDNSPLRGFKNTSFEGGIRVPAFVTGGWLNESRRGQIADDFIVSVTDWYPTLLSAAQIDPGYYKSLSLYDTFDVDVRFLHDGVGKIPLDGYDLWGAIQFGEVNDLISSDSRELLLDLDDGGTCNFDSCGAIRSGKWKFIRGHNMGVNESITNGTQWGSFNICPTDSDVLGCGNTEVTHQTLYCHLTEDGCLFDLEADPCERNDVGRSRPAVRQYLVGRLDYYHSIQTTYLISDSAKMWYERYDPAFNRLEGANSSFWGPYMDYAECDFEGKLNADYQRLYPDNTTTVRKHHPISSVRDAFAVLMAQAQSLSTNTVLLVATASAVLFLLAASLCLCFRRDVGGKYEKISGAGGKISGLDGTQYF